MLDFKFNFYLKFKDAISITIKLCSITSDNISTCFICKCGIDNPRFSDVNETDRELLSAAGTEKSWRCYKVAAAKIEMNVLKQWKHFNLQYTLFKGGGQELLQVTAQYKQLRTSQYIPLLLHI